MWTTPAPEGAALPSTILFVIRKLVNLCALCLQERTDQVLVVLQVLVLWVNLVVVKDVLERVLVLSQQ